MAEKEKTERLGVSRLEYFFSGNGWLFREQSLHDYGIDAQVEIVTDGKPTGQLVAMQIKSGKSYFSESKGDHFIHRTNDRHIEYWLNHSLPVIIALYNPDDDAIYWESISEDTMTATGKGWKIEIPMNKLLTDQSLDEIRQLTQPPPYIRKLNKLRLDKAWIELVASGESVYIEYGDWVNKSLPRFEITIGCEGRDDIQEESWPTLYGPGLSMEEAISHTIPWADYEMDYDAHCEFMRSVWFDECYSGRDSDDGSPYFTTPFEDWYKEPEEIAPVSDNGEVEGYRLILSLNEIGKAFLYLDDYLSEGDDVEDRVFNL